MPNSYLTLPQVSCYVGFWWSAGNAANYVELYDSNNQLLASFSAADLVSRLGNCSGPNSAYCGHPEFGFANGNELYAFVNLRLPAGFKTIRFWGQGFEIDNITTSISIPQHSASETAITTGDVRTDCSTVTATDANANLIACPRTVSIGVGSALDYDPRTDSQIAGYSYPGTTELAGVSVNSGAGSALLNGSGSAITLSSDTEGTYYVDFTISYGGATAVSRLTVNVTASQVVSLIAPDLILIDPRSSNVELGQVLLSGASNASMCVRPVADNQGTPFVGAPNFAINFSLANPLTTQSSLSDYLVLSGLTDDVATDAASVRIESGDRLTVNGAIYIQVSSVGGAASSAAQCDAGSSKIIEIRPLELQASQSLDFVFGLNR
jgi:hypothetical protein